MVTRRNLLKLGAASATVLVAGQGALVSAREFSSGGKDYSPLTGKERQAIPTACWQCVTRCPAIGYVENGRLVKIEPQPASIRTDGKMCAKGQAGVNQVYDPDRVLYPLKRVGARGEGKWKRISWDEALDEVASRLRKLRDDGSPEKFMFHYGRMKASSSKLIKDVFLATYGTKTIGNHTSICEGGKWTAQELTWGKHYDNWDIDNTKFILNFGSNCLEAHTNHIPVAQRLVKALADRRVRMVTFDVRLSNTAARSAEWVPVKPGTDGAVVLAMCNVVMSEELYRGEGEAFLEFCKVTPDREATTEDKVAALKAHLTPYTPEWAERVSGVGAEKIRLCDELSWSGRPLQRQRPGAGDPDAGGDYRQHRQSRRALPGRGRQVEVPHGAEGQAQGEEAEHHRRFPGASGLSDPPREPPGLQDDQGRQCRQARRLHVVLLRAGVLQR
jgi:anaerobic selenocysteine-containing dehydrogenase